jgi:hypothetical protein
MTYLPWIISAFLTMVCLVSFADINKARKARRDAEEENENLRREYRNMKAECLRNMDECRNARDENDKLRTSFAGSKHTYLEQIDDLTTQRDHLLQRLQSLES